MVLQFFEGKEYSFEELDLLSGKRPDQWTWPTQTFLWLLKRGYEIRLIEEFDYRSFGERGVDYIKEISGEEVAHIQEANSDIPSEQKLALRFAEKKLVEYRRPTLQDLQNYMKKGYLTICNINASLLYRGEGYSGHFIVPTEIGPDKITIHDPGHPPKPAQPIEITTFEAAWAYPNEKAKNLVAIRKKS